MSLPSLCVCSPRPLRLTRVLTTSLFCLLLLLLAACDSVEERVAEHYERGQDLLEQGLPQKAVLEFNNALQLDDGHAPSHFSMGQILEARGDLRKAFARYSKTVEIDPEHVLAQLKLVRFYMLGNETEKAEAALAVSLKLAPENAEAHALRASMALRLGDIPAARAALERASALSPGNVEVALVDAVYLQQTAGPEAALARVNEALTQHGANLPLHLLKLRILEGAGGQAAVGAHLATMIEGFPKETRFRQARAQWALQNDKLDIVETELRAIATALPGNKDAILNLLRFQRQQNGEDAVRAELAAQIGQASDPFPLELMLAQFDVETGRTEAAISYLRDLTGRASKNNANQTRVVLARLLLAEGETEEAYALLDTVLAEDPNDVEAMVLHIARLIEDDEQDDAIQMVRTALGEAPDDARLLTLAARAQELIGNINLASDRLAKAARVTAYDPEIVERYVEFLWRYNRSSAAETILSEAVSRHAENARLLDLMASSRLRLEDWGGAAAVISRLEALDADRARQLRAALLIGQERFDEGADLLQALPAQAQQRDASIAALVQTYVRDGKMEEAKAFLDAFLAKHPNSIQALGFRGNLYAADGDLAAAKARYEAILAIDPGNGAAHSALARLLRTTGDAAGAEKELRAGLDVAPDSVILMVQLAEVLDTQGDIENAVDLYQQAYQQAPDSLIVINNYASLLTDARAGTSQNIELAYKIAGRLQNAEQPQFQDTYGWTRHLKGEHERALDYLEPAAEALPGNPWVRYHVGMTYAALKQFANARSHLEAALVQSDGMDFPQAEGIRKTLAGLE